ncbi:winged helix-turn-helix domain-containing protein [Enterobacter roggenkampii]|uniref:winged helix-turn-helix domain-containing protein n=1 Tax=Enterobacter roggenkampii TaxID=1812935 RepID=UPI003BEA6274
MDGLIWLVDKDESCITLTVTTSRLLKFLLEKHGEVVRRDEIFKHVWDEHGLRSSNNSLNKYIFDLRNIFRDLGLKDELIVTVPRIGFMISADVFVESEIVNTMREDHKTEKELRKISYRWPASFGALLISLIFASQFLFNKKNDNELLNIIVWPVGKLSSCEVFSLNPISEKTTQQIMTTVRNILDSERLICTSDSEIYFQTTDSLFYGAAGRVFLSICKKSEHENPHFSSCYNYYEKAYEDNKN